MKKLFGTFILAMMAFGAYAQNASVTFKFINIVEGYDHNCKTEVFIDGVSKAVSPECKESVGSTFTFNVPAGKHDIRVMNYAQYEGNWEEHTVENQYSIDCMYEESGHEFTASKNNLYLIFDIDTQTHVSWGKKLKVKKIKGEAGKFMVKAKK